MPVIYVLQKYMMFQVFQPGDMQNLHHPIDMYCVHKISTQLNIDD